MTVGLLYPIYSDDSVSYTPTITGGAWDSDLPLSNLKDRRLARVARSTDTKLASTRLHLDLGVARSIGGLVIPKHTLSKTGAYVRALAQVSDMLFDYEAGDDVTVKGGTFTRASTATYVDRNGVVREAASGVIRDAHFIGGVRHTLLECASGNLCLQSENFGTAWTPSDTPTRVAAAHTASGVTLDLLGDDTSGGAEPEGYYQPITFTGNAVKAVSVFIKQGSSAGTLIRLYDGDAPSNPLFAIVGWSGGVPSLTTLTGSFLGYEAMADGVFRLFFRTESVIAAHANYIFVYPATTSGFTPSETGTVYIGGVQVENLAVPSSYKKTTTVAVTRNADVLSFTYTSVPQAMTVDVKVTSNEPSSFAGTFLYAIGTAAGARLTLSKTSAAASLTGTHSSAAGTVTSVPSTVMTAGQTLEARTVLSSTGTIIQTSSVASAAETVGATSAANALDGAWAATTLYLNSDATPANQGLNAFQYIRIKAAEQTMATMQAAVYDSGWTDAWPSGLDAEEATGINVPWVLMPSTAQSARYWSLQIDDYANATGYIDLARLVVANLYEPTINMNVGATLGLETDTIRTHSDGGAAIYNEKPVRRKARFVLDHITKAEAFASPWAFQRLAGTSGQLYFVYDVSDSSAMLAERSFLAVLEELGAMEEPYVDSRHSLPLQVLEEL